MKNEKIYQVIKEEKETFNYPIGKLCKFGNVRGVTYYKRFYRGIPIYEIENFQLAEEIEKIQVRYSDKRYSRI